MDYISYISKRDKAYNKAISNIEQQFKAGKLNITQFTRQADRLQKAYFKDIRKARAVIGI